MSLNFDNHEEIQNKRKKELDNISRPVLIEKIMLYERRQKDLMKHIDDLNKLIIKENEIVSISGQSNQEVVRRIGKVEMQRISQKFDEAFRVMSPKN